MKQTASMFRIGEKILVADITSALEDEGGLFLISAPTGETLHVRLQTGNVEVFRSAFQPDGKRGDDLWAIMRTGYLS
jgi:hypothetical protein